MSTTLTLDPSGTLVIPPEILSTLGFLAGGNVEVEETASGLVVRPAQSGSEARLVRNEFGELVIASNRRITDDDVIAAIAAERK